MDLRKFFWIGVGVSVAFWLGPAIGIPAAIGAGIYYGVKLVSGLVSSGMSFLLQKLGVSKQEADKMQERLNESKRQKMEKQNAKTRFFDPDFHQWKVSELPAGMTLENASSMTTTVMVNGVPAFQARSNAGLFPATFSTVLDPDDAEKIRNAFASDKGLAAKFEVKPYGNGGSVEVISKDPKAMLDLVNFLNPPVECQVKRTVESVNQFRVFGCSSLAEATEKLKRLKEQGGIQPFNSFVRVSDVVNEKALNDQVSGTPFIPKELVPGEYIINESRITSGTGVVTVAPLNDKDATYDAAAKEFNLNASGVTIDRQDEESTFTNAIGDRKLPQYMIRNGESNCRRISAESLNEETVNASIVLRFSSEKEMQEVISGVKPLVGHMVLLDDDIPAPGKGEYTVNIPATPKIIASLEMRDGTPEFLYDEYKASGLTKEEANISALLHEFRSSGYVSARLTEKFSFDNAFVNGVPIEDFNALADGKVKNKSVAEREQWLQDAALVKSVDMKIDIKKQELIISSSITTPTSVENRVEKRKLTNDQIYELSGRDITNAEMKDLLMKMYPDRFKRYTTAEGKSLFADPIATFINPKAVAKAQTAAKSESKQQSQENKPAQTPPKKKSNGVKL